MELWLLIKQQILGKNEVIVGNFGFDANAAGRDNLFKTLGKENYIKQMQEAGQKYTDKQYAFTGDTQVFSAISGEKLSKYNKGGFIQQFVKGGIPMQRQMEMFQDGGLEQDGGTVDPVSGNDVPIGFFTRRS